MGRQHIAMHNTKNARQQPELANRLVYELRVLGLTGTVSICNLPRLAYFWEQRSDCQVGFPTVAFLALASCWFATGQHLQLFAAVQRVALLMAVLPGSIHCKRSWNEEGQGALI